MYQATITSQGQISIPAESRRKIGLKPGDKVLVIPVGSRLEIYKDEGIDALRGVFAKYAVGKPKLTPKRLEKLREDFYTERYRRFLKQDEPGNR